MVAVATRPQDCEAINRLEAELASRPQAKMKLAHAFVHDPELGVIQYVRTVVLAAGTCYTTKIHRKEHVFMIARGRCTVVEADGSRSVLAGPHLGITKPGTRRAILVEEETVWTTFHMTNTVDLREIERQLIIPHAAPETVDGSSCLPDADEQPVLFISESIKESPCLK